MQENGQRKVQRNGRPIAVFDSGVGGLPYLTWMKKHLPDERFVYLADRANFPYGEKSETELKKIVLDTVGRFIETRNPKIMVIACNTASVVALADLRRQFEIPFIGVVPAVKPAAEMSAAGSIGILATRRTVHDPYTDDLVDSFASECSVSRYAGVEIVDLVENRFFSAGDDEKHEVLTPVVDFFKQRDVDVVVVACTHFIFVMDQLQRMLGEDVSLIDSREGVGRQTINILRRQGMLNAGPARTEDGDYFYITKEEDERKYRKFASAYGLNWGGRL